MTTKNYYISNEKFVSRKEKHDKTSATATAPHMISYLCHIPGKLSFTVTATNIHSSGTIHF